MSSSPTAARSSPSPPRRRSAYRWLIGLLVLGAVVVASRGLGEERRFAELFRNSKPIWLALVIALQLATYLCLARAWAVAIRRTGGTPPRLASLVQLALVELFTDQALPSGGLGGTLVVVRALRRRGVPASASAAAVVASLLGLYVAQLLAVLLSIGALLARHRFIHFAIAASSLALIAATRARSPCSEASTPTRRSGVPRMPPNASAAFGRSRKTSR